MNRHSLPAAVIVPSILVATPAVASTSIAAAMQDADEFTARPPTSWYVRASGMAIDQQDAALRDRTAGNVIESALTMAGLPSSGWELESDTGSGFRNPCGLRRRGTAAGRQGGNRSRCGIARDSGSRTPSASHAGSSR